MDIKSLTTSQFPSKGKFMLVINKEQAQAILKENLFSKRPIDHTTIHRFTKEMNSGKWETREDSFLVIGKNSGCLNDGVRRLHAFINSRLDTFETYARWQDYFKLK